MPGEALLYSDQFFRALIEHSSDAIMLLAPDGTIIYASPSTTPVTGYAPDEMLGMNTFALLHPADQGSLREQLTTLIEHVVESLSLEYRLRCKDGSWRRLESTFSNLLDHPQVGAIVCSARDITRRIQLPAFEEAGCKFHSLVESNIVGLMVTDQEGRMYEVNDRLVQLLGYSQDELLGGDLRVKDVLLPQYHSARTRAWRILMAHGASLPEEKIYVRKDRSSFPAVVAAATINVERLSGISSLGMHDLLSNLETMLQQAQRQAEIETRLVAELLDMSRMETPKFELSLQRCNLVTIVQQVVANQQQVAPRRRLELALPSQAQVPVVADADRIEQPLTNYLTNAFKYSSPEQVVWVHLCVEGLTARVSVRDQGPGLTLEQQQRVWDRFYQVEDARSQGPDEGGLGLGLYIVRNIIARHQGQVGVESFPGQGATFWFLLPLADEAAMA